MCYGGECASSAVERIDMHGRGNRANTSRALAHCGRRGTCEGMDERVTGERGRVIYDWGYVGGNGPGSRGTQVTGPRSSAGRRARQDPASENISVPRRR